MPSRTSQGTQTAVLGETHEISAEISAANFVPYIDLAAMVLGDWVQLSVEYLNRSTGGTLRKAQLGNYHNTQELPVVYPPPLSVIESAKYYIRQRTGTMTITSMTGTVAVGDTVTGATSTATGVVEWMDSAGTPTEIRIRVTSDGTAFQDAENAEVDGSNYLVLNDATPAQAFPWSVVDPS